MPGFTDNLRNGNNANLLSLGSGIPENYDGGINDFANQVLNLHKDAIARTNAITDAAMRAHAVPINPWAAPFTTDNNISHGLSNPNPEIATTFKDNGTVSPLDKLKLAQGQEKIDATKSKEQGELSFKQSNADATNQIRQQRADIYDYKSKHPDVKFDTTGATVKAMNPADGSVYDTGLSTDKLSMEDRMNLAATNKVMTDTNKSNVDLSNNITRDNNNSNNRTNEIVARGNQTRKTNDSKPNNKSTSNSQVLQGYLNKAQELLNTNPSYAPYIKLGKSDNGKVNGFTVSPINGQGDPLYHDINSRIYGNSGDVSIPSDRTNKSDDTKLPDPAGIR